MKQSFFIYGLILCHGITWCSNLCLNSSSELMRTTPYSFLGTTIAIELPDEKGVIHNLANYNGTPCIVCFIKNIMAGEQCVLLSYLLRLNPWFQKEGIQLFGITTEPIDSYSNDGSLLPFPILLDYKQTVSKNYCTDANSPFSTACTTFIIDENGIIKKVLNLFDSGELIAQLAISVLEMKKNQITQTPEVSSSQRSPAPDVELFDFEGNLVKLSSYRGTWVLLAFANTIRGTWEYERFLYLLNDIYEWLQQYHITILCACTESVEDLACFQKHSGLRYRLLSDSKHIIPECFKEPWSLCNDFLSYLIDPAGNKVTTFISASANLHFAQLCHYIIVHQKTHSPLPLLNAPKSYLALFTK